MRSLVSQLKSDVGAHPGPGFGLGRLAREETGLAEASAGRERSWTVQSPWVDRLEIGRQEGKVPLSYGSDACRFVVRAQRFRQGKIPAPDLSLASGCFAKAREGSSLSIFARGADSRVSYSGVHIKSSCRHFVVSRKSRWLF